MIDKLNGKIIIITAPSGSGKTTIANYLLKKFKELSFSVSATTRAPREGETEGVNYFFLDQQQFQQAIKKNELLEYQEVYPGQYYGTLVSELKRIWTDKKIALFDIDVKGAYVVESSVDHNVLSIYIKASSLEVLRQRLLLRGTETPASIKKRLEKAEAELEYAKHFDYVITNDKLELATKIIGEIVADFIKDPVKGK
jgi:guanylate kinase